MYFESIYDQFCKSIYTNTRILTMILGMSTIRTGHFSFILLGFRKFRCIIKIVLNFKSLSSRLRHNRLCIVSLNDYEPSARFIEPCVYRIFN